MPKTTTGISKGDLAPLSFCLISLMLGPIIKDFEGSNSLSVDRKVSLNASCLSIKPSNFKVKYECIKSPSMSLLNSSSLIETPVLICEPEG